MADIDFDKLPADKHVTVWIGPSGEPLGITDVAVPTAAELNNIGGVSGVLPASQSISWNDYSFGLEASETRSEPSLADDSTYEEFGNSNFGGSISFFLPKEYDDNSNLHSLIYDLTDEPGARVDVATRIDGAIPTTVPAANGDFVSVFRAEGASEQNPFTMGESTRRTVGFNSRGEFANYTIVGPHTITPADATLALAPGAKGRLRAIVQDRDYTNALAFSTSNGAVIDIARGGFYRAVSAGSATITITDEDANTTATVTVTVA